jgi:hypothetical protein
MVWELIQSVVADSTTDSLETDEFTGTDYTTLQITVYIPSGAAHHGYLYFNSDSDPNYARAGSINYGSRIEVAPDNEINLTHATNTTKYAHLIFNNNQDEIKCGIAEYTDRGTAGAGNVANTIEWFYKWTNATASINQIELYNQEAGSSDFPVGTYLNVFGDKQ